MKGSDLKIQQIKVVSSATELIYEKNFEPDDFDSIVSVNIPENMVYSNDFDTGFDIHYYYHGCNTLEIESFSLNYSKSKPTAFKAIMHSLSFSERFKEWMKSNDAIKYFKADWWDWTLRRRNKQKAAQTLYDLEFEVLDQEYHIDILLIDKLVEDIPMPPTVEDLITLSESRSLEEFSVIFNYLLTDLKALLLAQSEENEMENVNIISQSFNSTFLISQNLQFKAAGLCFMDQLYDFYLTESEEISYCEISKRAL